jgi:carboxylate-amine ligase
MNYRLFDVFGVELEYMIVDNITRKVKPIADLIFLEKTGKYISDYENGDIAWSNELVTHVLELKTNGPAPTLNNLEDKFYSDVCLLNDILKKHNAQLMPGGAHPFMNPYEETVIWPHEHNQVYNLYNRIFDCRGHGWANLQSTHLNLPFSGNEEFSRLHAAIRLLMPIMPALAASTPILDSKLSGYLDTRLEFYRNNQQKIPIIAGLVIPEPVYSEEEYHEHIFNPIKASIRPFDSEGILDHHFLNSRGAIARFDRGAIEIRILDIQECPSADIAVLQIISTVLRELCQHNLSVQNKIKSLPVSNLSTLFLRTVQQGENAVIDYQPLLELLNLRGKSYNAGDIWKELLNRHSQSLTDRNNYMLSHILQQGSLATRILQFTGPNPSREVLEKLCDKMMEHLATDTFFTP